MIEDVLVKVDTFIFPIYFMHKGRPKQIPIILDRQFLSMGTTLIDVQKNEPTMGVHNQKVFNFMKSMQ